MRNVGLICAVALMAGCVGMPDQKLADGQTGCATVNTAYGKASAIVTRADNVAKGHSTIGKTRITCGDSVMEIESTITAPPPVIQVPPPGAAPVAPPKPVP